MITFKRKLALACVIVFAVCCVLYLPFRSRWQDEEQQTKAFCESLLPLIEQSRSALGSYPTNANLVWLAGRSVPFMIRTQDFYVGQDDRFFLRFYRPGLGRHAFYSVWCYHSHEREWFRQYEY
jgi:hypothetical protein